MRQVSASTVRLPTASGSVGPDGVDLSGAKGDLKQVLLAVEFIVRIEYLTTLAPTTDRIGVVAEQGGAQG